MSWSTAPKGGGKPKFPWTKGKPSEFEARLLANMRSALHEAQSHSSGGAVGGGAPKQSGWSHRKAEWICPSCQTCNFVENMDCRRCGRQWSAEAKVVAAGTPPQSRKGQPSTGLFNSSPAGSQPVNGAERDAVKLAEAALQSSKDANVPQAVLTGLQENLDAKRREATAKQPVAKRLQQATHRQTQSKTALDKAEEKLAAATKAAEEARVAYKQTEEEVRKVTAEVAQSDRAPAPVPAEKDLLARLVAAISTLDTAMGTEGEAAAKAGLLEASKAAQGVLQEAPATPPPAAEATTGQTRPREEVLSTQVGDVDLEDRELEEMLANLHPSKRQRAAARLAQLGVQEQQQLQDHQQQQDPAKQAAK